MDQKDCIFCQIASGASPADKVYEEADLVAFRDTHPKAPVHVLIVPKKHINRLSEATLDDSLLLGKIQLIAKSLAEKLGITDGFSLTLNNGRKAGQIVDHLHYHLMGGWENNPSTQT